MLTEIEIVSYKESGRYYTSNVFVLSHETDTPMLENGFKEQIMNNTGTTEQMPVITFSKVSGDAVHVEGCYLNFENKPSGTLLQLFNDFEEKKMKECGKTLDAATNIFMSAEQGYSQNSDVYELAAKWKYEQEVKMELIRELFAEIRLFIEQP